MNNVILMELTNGSAITEPKIIHSKSHSMACGVRAVDRALHVLFTISEWNQPISLAQLSKQTGFYKSTILRLINSLLRAGLVMRRPDGNYELGHKLPILSERYIHQVELGQFIPKAIDILSNKTGYTTTFFVLDDEQQLCLFSRNSKHIINTSISVGTYLSLNMGAAGHVITNYTSVTPLVYSENILPKDVIYKADEEDYPLASIAAPVFKDEITFVGALSLVGPHKDFHESMVMYLKNLLADVATNLSKSLINKSIE